jgi:hypothetical protein
MDLKVKTIGDRVLTNYNCDFPNKFGNITQVIGNGVAVVVKLDDGMNILTMSYAVDVQK